MPRSDAAAAVDLEATPVRNSASSEARNSDAAAMSLGRLIRPRGMVAVNFARSSGESPPMNSAVRPVSPITGQIALTRILSGASSTAIDLLIVITAPLEALYQVSPGRGLSPAVDAMLTMLPPPCLRNTGTAWTALQ